MNDNESRKWLYNTLQSEGYNVGSNYEEFDSLMNNNEESRKWCFDRARELGYNVGKDYDEFNALVGPQATPAAAPQQPSQPGEQRQRNMGTPGTMVGAIPWVKPPQVQPMMPAQQENKKHVGTPGDKGVMANPYDFSSKPQEEMNKRVTREEVEQAVPKVYYPELRSQYIDKTVEEYAPELGTAADWTRRNKEAQKAQKEHVADQVNQMLGEVESMRGERIREINKEVQASGKKSVFTNPALKAVMDDEQIGMMKAAERKLKKLQGTIEEAQKHADDPNWFAEFGRGMGAGLSDISTWDFGITDLADVKKIQKALEKYDRISVAEAFGGETDEKMTPAEQALLDAVATEIVVNEYYGSDVSNWYKGGQSTAVSLPFMASMMVSPAMAAGRGASAAMARYITKRFAQTAAKKGVQKVALRAAEGALKASSRVAIDAAAATLHTAMFDPIRIEADTRERIIGQIMPTYDREGNVKYGDHKAGDSESVARRKAAIDKFIQNESEMLGDYIPGLKVIFGNSKLAKRFLANKFVNNIAQMERRAQFHGFLPEAMEEIVGGVMNASWVGDQTLDADPETGVFSKDNLSTIAISIGATTVAMGCAKLGGYGVSRAMLGATNKKASQLFGNEWNDLRARLQSDDMNEVSAAAEEIRTSDKYTEEQKKAAIKYASLYTGLNAYEHMEADKVDVDAKNANDTYQSAYENATGEDVRRDITIIMEQSREKVRQTLGNEILQMMETEDPLTVKQTLEETQQLTGEQATALADYVAAHSAVEGVEQRIEDDADMQVAQQREAYNLQRNDDDGSVHPATMTVNGQEREVFIKSGLVTTGADGSIDIENSGETIVVYDPVEGKNKMVSPADIRSLGDVTTAEQFEEGLLNQRADFVQQQQDAATGRFNPQPGQEIDMPDGKAVVLATDGETVTLQMPDGTQQSMAIADIQQIADGVMMEDYRQRHPETAAPEQPAAEAPAMTEGKPETFEPNMELTIKDGDGEKTVYVTDTRARWEAGKFVEDPAGKFIELYDPEANDGNGGMTYIREDDPEGKIVRYKPAPLEEQPADETENRPLPRYIDPKNPPDDGGTPPPPPAGLGNLKDAKTFGEQEEEQRPNVETLTPEDYTPEEPVTQPAPDRDAMPMRQVKRKVDGKMTAVEEEDWMATTPARAYQYLYEYAVARGLPVETADNLVQANLKAAQGEKERAKKAVGSVMSILQKQNAAQAAVDYWKQVQSLRNRALLERKEAEAAERRANETAEQRAKREAFEAEQAQRLAEAEAAELRRQEENEQKANGTFVAPVQNTEITEPIEGTKTSATPLEIAKRELADDAEAMEILNSKEPQTLEEVASVLLTSGKNQKRIIPEDFYKHTGYGPADAESFSFILSNKGVSISRLGEMVEEEARNENIPFDENDANAGLDAVLAVLGNVRTQGDINNYITNNRIRQAYEHHDEMLSREEDLWIEAHDGLTRAEHEGWIAYFEEQAAALNGQKYEDYYNKIAESTLNSHDDTRSETDLRGGREEGTGALQGQEGLQTPDTRDGSRRAEGSGSREKRGPAESAVAERIAAAEAQTDTNPTEGQKKAGNYAKGHLTLDGYNISIEQPKGSIRRGVDADGRAWEQEMHNTYGYIRGTEGVDGDHIDVFLSDDPTQGNVFVIDQVNKDGSFDEHKVMYGFPDAESARAAYLSNYEEGWQGLGTITEVSKDEFKKWVESSHRKTKPFSEYRSVEKLGGQNEVADEEALASRMEVNYDDETTEEGPNGTIYRRPIIIDGIHRVEQVNEPDEKGHYTGSYYMYGGKRYGDLPDVFSYIDSNPAPREEASITPTQYTTKKGKVLDMQLVKFDKELTKEQFKAAKEIARKSMGWWSAADGGFLMRSEDAARQLVDSMSDKETVADEQPVSLEDMNTVADVATMDAIDEAAKEEEVGYGRGTYTTKDGVQLSMMSLFEEGNLNDNANLNDKGDLTALRLRKLEPGETCHVERRYEENKSFSFTGKEKIESMDDVAYIFKQLENAAVENSFIALVKDGKPIIIHTGMGGYASSPVDIRQAVAAYMSINPEQVYFVHNHPSGSLRASEDDRRTLNSLRAAFGNDVVQDGIIIDTTSGKYGVFGPEIGEGEFGWELGEKNRGEVPMKVYEFSKQVFSKDWKPQMAYTIAGFEGVAEFISSHRLGEHPKMSFIIVNNQHQVVGNLFLPWTALSEIEDVKATSTELSNYINLAGGTKGVIYGNYQYSEKDKRMLQQLAAGMNVLRTPLLDVVHVDVNDELGYHSAHDSGVMEPEEEYVTPKREAGESILDYAKRVADDYSAYESIVKALNVANGGIVSEPVTDKEVIKRLEAEPKIKVYRSMQLIDGELYPPMSAKVDGQLRQPSKLGEWEQSEEMPDMVDENGKFKLDKGNKKSLKAAYNPYIHGATTMLNDQFSEAQDRPNLVVVEMEVPVSELTSGYRAEKAKDAVGMIPWKAGVIQGKLTGKRDVMLSRWAKPVRIVPVEEVAENIAKQIEGQIDVMPSNVVTPQVRAELEKRGVQFVETDNTGKIKEGENKGKTWASVYGKNLDKVEMRESAAMEQQVETAVKSGYKTPQRKAGESLVDYAQRVSDGYSKYEANMLMAHDDSVSEQLHDTSREMYERLVGSSLNQFTEAMQDSMKSLESLMKAMLGDKDLKKEEVAGFENPYLVNNAMSSASHEQKEVWHRYFIDPLKEEIRGLLGKVKGKEWKDAYTELVDYLMAKHGLERNDVFAKRDAKKSYSDECDAAIRDINNTRSFVLKELKKKLNDNKIDQDTYNSEVEKTNQDIEQVKTRFEQERDAKIAALEENPQKDARYRAFRGKDYSGLTALTGSTKDASDIDEAENKALADLESRHHAKLIDDEAYKQEKEQIKRLAEKQRAGIVAMAEHKAEKMVAEYESKHDTKALWKKINAATNSTLFKLADSGIMSAEQHDRLRDMFQYYIPLQGFNDTVAEDLYAYMGGKGTLGVGSLLKGAKGRKSKADDPLATIILNGEAAIRQANRNLMKQKFLNFVLNHPGNLVSIHDIWLRKNDTTGQWERYFEADLREDDSPEVVASKMQAFEDKMAELADQDPAHYKRGRELPDVPYRVIEKKDMDQHQVLVRRNGQTVVLTINGNPRAAQALNGLTNPDVDTEKLGGKIVNGIQKFTRFLATNYTSRFIDFMAANWVRDAFYANDMAIVREDAKYASKFHKEHAKTFTVNTGILFKEWNNGELQKKIDEGTANKYERYFREFMLNGGETGWTNQRDLEKHKRDLERDLRHAEDWNVRAWKAFTGFLDIANRAIENNARFAAYVSSRDMGRSITRSIWDAKEVSVNFNTKGAGSKMAGAKGQTTFGDIGAVGSGIFRTLFPFWNASVQGISNIYRAAKRRPGRFALRILAVQYLMGALIPLISQWLCGDDDDDPNSYYNLPEYVRRSNLCFRFTKSMPWITLPLPIEFRAPYGLGELSMGLITGKEHYTPEEAAKQFAMQISQVLPLDFMEGGGGWHVLMPGGVKPALEAQANESWSGLPIYKESSYDDYKANWTKGYKNTSKPLTGFTKGLNELTADRDDLLQAAGNTEHVQGYINWNPAVIEYLLRGYLGGLYSTANQLVKVGETIAGGREFEWRNIPVANRFIKEGDERTQARKLQNEYFYYVDEYEGSRKRLKDADKENMSAGQKEERQQKLDKIAAQRHYWVVDAYKPLLDALHDQKQNESEYSVVEIEELENSLRRQMVDLIHKVDDNKELPKDSIDKEVDKMLAENFERGGYTRHPAANRIANRLGGRDSYGGGSALNTEYGKVYERKRDYVDMAEDVLLQVAIKEAKEENDVRRQKGLEACQRKITEAKEPLGYPNAKAEVIDNAMAQVRTLRRQALDKYGIDYKNKLAKTEHNEQTNPSR